MSIFAHTHAPAIAVNKPYNAECANCFHQQFTRAEGARFDRESADRVKIVAKVVQRVKFQNGIELITMPAHHAA